MSRLLCHLSYTAEPDHSEPNFGLETRSPLTESNRRPSPYHGDALPTELRGRRTAYRRTRTGKSTRPARRHEIDFPRLTEPPATSALRRPWRAAPRCAPR